jgi:hypothetical protein
MPVSNYKREECQRVAKRLKKSEFADYLVRLEEEHERALARAREEGRRSAMESVSERADKLAADMEQLAPVRAVIRAVVSKSADIEISDAQLQLMLDSGGTSSWPADNLPDELQNPHDVLLRLLDNCGTFCEKFAVDNPEFGIASYDEMGCALEIARADREALLKRLGLTEREWVLLGGASYTDVEP